MGWHIKSTGTIAEIQAELNALVVESEIEEQQFLTVKEVFNNSVGEGTTTAQSVVPNTFLEGVFPADNSKLQLIASGYMNGRVSVVNYTLEVVKLNAAGEIIGTVSSSAFNTTTITQGGGGGEGDGLIFGPDPETADSIQGGNDYFLAPFDVTNFTEISFGDPVTVTNEVDFNGCALMTSLEFRRLETIGGEFNFESSVALDSVVADSLQTVGGNFLGGTGGDASNVTTLSCNELVSVGGNFDLSGCILTSLSLPVFATVTGNCALNFTGIIALVIPSLTTVGVELQVEDCSSLTSISLPSLTTITAASQFKNNPLLASFSAPVWLPTDGPEIEFTNCALTAASVNHILARCVAAGLTTSTIDLSGGTNAAPTGQGIIDANALTVAGCTVTTN